MSECPCGSGRDYESCCGPIISGAQPAATAEALMRSRYSAYVKHDYKHLEQSLSEAQRSDFSLEETRKWAESAEWLGLTVRSTEKGGPEDTEGVVEFSAKFRIEGKEHEHVEAGSFVKKDTNWFYDGTVQTAPQTIRREAPKIGRNDPCPCGSGKKYKKCCGAAA
jgi:SEC-C motif domain protein